MTSQALPTRDERGQPTLVNGPRSNINKDNWLGFVGDVVNFTGEVCFKSMLRIDGHFSGNVTSPDGTLIISTGAEVTKAVIKVAVAKINGTVEGDIRASKQLVLGRTANVKGQVTAPALVVEEGCPIQRPLPPGLGFSSTRHDAFITGCETLPARNDYRQ